MKDELLAYLSSNPRTKLVLLRDQNNELNWLDIGHEVCSYIEPLLNSPTLGIETQSYLNKLLRRHLSEHETIGSYIALSNTSVLFEPDLSIDIDHLLEQWSKTFTVFFELPKAATIQNNRVWLENRDMGQNFDLSDVSYLLLN